MISSVQHRDRQWIIKQKLISRGLPDCICSATAAKHSVPNQSWSKRGGVMHALMALPPSSWNNSPRPLLCQGLDQVLQGRTAEAGWCSTTRRLSFALEVCRGWFEPLAQLFPQGSCSLGAGGPRAADSTASPNTLRGSCEQPAAFCLCFLPPPHTLSHHLSLHSQCRANLPPESNCLKKQDQICLYKTPASFSARVTELRPVPAPCEYFQHYPCFPHRVKDKTTLPRCQGRVCRVRFPRCSVSQLGINCQKSSTST